MKRLLRTIRQFLSELRRRNVYQVAVAYFAAGFVVVELANIAAGAFNLPGWFQPMVWTVCGLGFPIALVMAWALEVTPEGVRVERSVAEETDGSEEIPTPAHTARDLWVGASVLVLLLFGAWWMWGVGVGEETPSDSVTDQTVDSTRVAVFPFTIGGEGELGHLREGMVELLGRSLDGAGRLRVVDPNTLLGRLGERAEGGVAPETARRVAAEFGAGRFVLGRVLRLGDRLRLSGTWYSTGGREIGSAEATGEGETEIQRMVEDLARQAIADLAGGGAEQRRRLAAQTTSSAEALKAYLKGQQAFRARNLQPAMDAFARAVAVDSTFALAHYRLSLSAGWNWELEAMHRHARRAASLSEPLPERDRRLLRAHAAYISGKAERAERLCRALLQTHPDDAEAHYKLGETLFHYNSVRGRPVAEAQGPFRRAMQLNPTFNQPLIHRVHIAALEGEQGRIDSLTSGLEARGLSPGPETMYRTIHAYTRPGEIDSTLKEKLREGSPPWTCSTAYPLIMAEKPSVADTLAGMLTPSHRPEELRAAARALQAEVRALQGRIQAAHQKASEVAPLDSAAYWMTRARLVGLPFVPEQAVGTAERRTVADGLAAWAADEVPERLLSAFLPPREIYPAGRLYHLGLLRARLGEPDEALRAADRLDAMDAPFFASSGPSDLARSVRAEVYRSQGRPEEALRQLEAIESHIDPLLVLGGLYSAARERFVRAELLAAAGRHEEALRWYRTLNGLAYGAIPYIAPAHLGRAQALEKLGRPGEAAEAYRRFLNLWANADPILQPKVEQARQRLADLEATAEAVSAPELKSNP